jgi:hypothetical protein
MEIYIKTLSGGIQPLSFPKQEITVKIVKDLIKRPGYNICLFRDCCDSKGDDDIKEDSQLGDEEKISNKEVLNIFYVREDFTKKENEKFESLLKRKLNKFYDNFRDAIIKYDGIIAGGSVLSIFGDYEMNDLDIYVHYSKAKDFIKTLYIHGCIYGDFHQAPAYDQSFFRKNNIMARFYMKYVESHYERVNPGNPRRLNYNFISIDIMVIPDNIPLDSVVTNFDLTFCQVWWDGKRIWSDNIEDIKTKTGSLNKDYINSYLSMNSFIVKRILKYKKRGFTINIDLSDIQSSNIVKQPKSITTCSEKWARSCVIKYLIKKYFNVHNGSFIFSYFIIEDTYGNMSGMTDMSDMTKESKDLYEALVKECYRYIRIYLRNDKGYNYKEAFNNVFYEILKLEMSFSECITIINEWKANIKNETIKQLESIQKERDIIKKIYNEI